LLHLEKHIHQFFVNLNFIINIVVGSSKCNDELQSAQVASIEIETGRGQTKSVLCNDLEILDGLLIFILFQA
jgi:hypothetical protein